MLLAQPSSEMLPEVDDAAEHPGQEASAEVGSYHWATYAFLSFSFFLVIHNFLASTWNINRSADFFTATSGSGSLPTKIAFLLLGLFGGWGVVRPHMRRLQPVGMGSLLALLLLALTLISFLWSLHPAEPIGRLVGVLALVLTAIRLRRELTWLACLRWITTTTTTYIAIGFLTELALRTFQPWDVEYRFSGTLHPNAQGVNCSIALLGACCLFRSGQNRKGWGYVAAIALIFDVLTKSRTSFFSLIIAGILWALLTQRSRLRAQFSIIGLGFVLSLGAWLYGIGMAPSLSVLQMGRDTGTSDNASLTGRMPLWSELLESTRNHLLVGQGFGAFWTPDMIEKISSDQGWGISAAHSAYVDILLSLGLIGLGLYLCVVGAAVAQAWSEYQKKPSVEISFFGILLLFAMIDGVTDSEPVIVSAFLCFCTILSLTFLLFRRQRLTSELFHLG